MENFPITTHCSTAGDQKVSIIDFTKLIVPTILNGYAGLWCPCAPLVPMPMLVQGMDGQGEFK